MIAALVNVYLLLLFVVGYGFQTEAIPAKPIVLSMAVAGILLPIFGVLHCDPRGIAGPPGLMPSLTGSYLHFPLLCGILVICMLEAAKALRWRFLYFVSFLSFVGVGISGGRSGAFVLTGAVGSLYSFSLPEGPLNQTHFGALVISVVVCRSVAAAYQYSRFTAHIPMGQEGGKRESATLIWTKIYHHWLDTNLWFGEYTGMVGNTTGMLAAEVIIGG